MKKEDIKNN